MPVFAIRGFVQTVLKGPTQYCSHFRTYFGRQKVLLQKGLHEQDAQALKTRLASEAIEDQIQRAVLWATSCMASTNAETQQRGREILDIIDALERFVHASSSFVILTKECPNLCCSQKAAMLEGNIGCSSMSRSQSRLVTGKPDTAAAIWILLLAIWQTLGHDEQLLKNNAAVNSLHETSLVVFAVRPSHSCKIVP